MWWRPCYDQKFGVWCHQIVAELQHPTYAVLSCLLTCTYHEIVVTIACVLCRVTYRASWSSALLQPQLWLYWPGSCSPPPPSNPKSSSPHSRPHWRTRRYAYMLLPPVLLLGKIQVYSYIDWLHHSILLVAIRWDGWMYIGKESSVIVVYPPDDIMDYVWQHLRAIGSDAFP